MLARRGRSISAPDRARLPDHGRIAAKRLKDSDERVILVEDKGEVVGLATVATARMLTHDQPIARLTALVVKGTRRRGGFASQLVDGALQIAAQTRCEGMEVTSGIRPERAAAHAFYEARGFERTSYRYWRKVERTSAR